LTASMLLSWREGVATEADADGALCVRGPRGRVALRQPTPAIVTALRHLAPPGEDEGRLAELVLDAGGPGALPGWYYLLQRLARQGAVCRAVQAEGQRLATLLPTAPSFLLTPTAVAADRPHLLSRFAFLRREDERMVLESPLAPARVVLNDGRCAALIGALATPATARELAGRVCGLPAKAVAPLLGLLAGAGMLAETGPDGREEPPALWSWEFHDLLFHARSRKGRSEAPFGATYRMAGRLDPPPAIKASAAGEACELYRPDLERLRREDPPLAEIVERRRSHRDYGDRAITARQLGEFLYRVARLKEFREVEVATPGGPVRMTFASRPYPSGGALYELEFYLAINACDGLAPGLYHYDAMHHRLGRLCPRTGEVGRLLADGAGSAGLPVDRVQVLLILSARFQRLAWKYASIAYALILKHVGVVYQSMYLAATAMGLAPCALGGGDSDLFARAAGTDYHAETSVGEFLLGSRNTSANEGR
jgi:SagB-type dehydrogenase family enzyme